MMARMVNRKEIQFHQSLILDALHDDQDVSNWIFEDVECSIN